MMHGTGKGLINFFFVIFFYLFVIYSPANTQPPTPQRYLSDSEINYESEAGHSKDNSGNQMTWNWGSLPQVKILLL